MDDHQGEPSPWAKETALTDIQKKLEAYIEQEEGASHRFQGIPLLFVCVLAVLMSLFHLYAAYEIVPTQLMRSVHVAMVLALIFLLFPVARRFRDQLHWWDFCFALVPLLQFSGAGKFFIDFSFAAMGGRPTGVGRTVVLASFLLGGPSGSGVATTVTIGTVAYPMLAKAGYEKNAAGGLLAAAGLGAIISPPVLGAAAFLIAEFLKLSYLDVLLMACIPTLLFYVSLFIMVEIDARKYGMRDASFEAVESVWGLASRYWFHFFSLVSIIVFMLMGFSPTMSVLYATGVSLLTSFFRADTSLIPYQLLKPSERPWYERILDVGLIKALQGGAVGTLGVAVTCACAGLIVGTVTLTGLGLKFSGIVIEYAAGSLLLTAIYTALIVWVVGLAVPVTASYIICAVVAAPALIKLGVPDFAAHMFIFYYAVLSEVSPPTALSPFAAAAITGGDPYKTTLQSWKYTLPAFLVPFVFVLDQQGVGLLLMGSMKALGDASMASIAWISLSTALGILAMSGAFQGWLLVRVNVLERMLLIFAGIALVFRFDYNTSLGIAALTIVLLWQGLRSRQQG
ncbi:MAG: TRAP transporter fused permease subunit [Betaproteobacteria bacterium]|nr:TRAP transporter fused permease subunit [Betaproteobacteria bacterium]